MFSQRVRRAGAFSAVAASQKPAPPPEEAFAGQWIDDDGTLLSVSESQIVGPDGSKLPLEIKSRTECSFEMGGETYTGILSDGTLTWNDGCVWTRKQQNDTKETKESTEEAQRKAAAEEAARQQVEEELRRDAEERERKADEARKLREEQRQAAVMEARKRAEEMAQRRRKAEEEEARQEQAKPMQMEATRQAPSSNVESDAQGVSRGGSNEEETVRSGVAPDNVRTKSTPPAAPDANSPEFAEAKAKSQAGLDKARQAFEAEKARKAAALERARAEKLAKAEAGNQPPEAFSAAKAKSQAGLDKAKMAFEAEKARKAAALARVRAEKEAKAQADAESGERQSAIPSAKAGLDRARQRFEDEKNRRAAAMESMQTEKAADPAGQAEGEAEEYAKAKARSQAGLDKAKQRFEEEKARKAAAVERARAQKEAEAAAEAAANADGRSEPPAAAPTQRMSGLEKARQKYEEEKNKRTAAIQKAQAEKLSQGTVDEVDSPPVAKRPSAFETATSARAPPKSRPPPFESSRPSPQEAEPSATVDYQPGMIVRLEGLVAKPELNGRLGELMRFDEARLRWEVVVEDIEGTCNLKEVNFVAVSDDEWWEIQQQRAQEQGSPMADEGVSVDSVVSQISQEALRWADAEIGKIVQKPGANGNPFDISLRGHGQGREVSDILSKKGVCLCEANAGDHLMITAFEEAERLWKGGHFAPPMQDMGASELEAALWQQVLYPDEKKVAWIAEQSPHIGKMSHLQQLSEQMKRFASTIADPLARKMKISWTGMWDCMLACYAGKRTYNFHLDNPCNSEETSLPDNGLRVSLCLFINPHWSPQDDYNGGGLDVFLTDPSKPPSSMTAARKADRLRVAPHADTLVVFLSQHMPHQVVKTENEEPWFCLWLWTVDEQAMSYFPTKVLERQGISWEGDGNDGNDWQKAEPGDNGLDNDSDADSDPPDISENRGGAAR